MAIIIGASGFIGRHLYNYFSEKSAETIGTYCNSSNTNSNLRYFDLRKPNLKNLESDLKKHKHVFICSAITRPDECKIKEKESREINVTGTKDLILQCFDNNLAPIFFSSEYVFNGENGNYKESDKKTPNTVYGCQKAEIEDFLLSTRNSRCLIIRLGHIFGLEKNDKTIITSIAEQLIAGKTLNCAKDQIFNSTYVGDLTELLDISLQKNLNGLYNLVTPETHSRYELASIIKSELDIKSGVILPCSIKDFKFADNRPLNMSLDSGKIISETGFNFPSLKSHLKKLKEVYK